MIPITTTLEIHVTKITTTTSNRTEPTTTENIMISKSVESNSRVK